MAAAVLSGGKTRRMMARASTLCSIAVALKTIGSMKTALTMLLLGNIRTRKENGGEDGRTVA
jgi:hypothetical protein